MQSTSMDTVGTLVGGEPRFEGGLVELSEGVHGWLQPNGDLGESNAGLISGDGESLMVDTLWDLHLTRRMLAAMQPLLGVAPAKRLFNTHGDGDHWWGNELIRGAEVIATEDAAAQMAHDTPKEIGRMTRVLGLGRIASSVPLVPFPRKGQLRNGSSYFRPRLSAYDWSEISPTQPKLTFTGTMELDVGGRKVVLEQVGPAHTAGDAIAIVPDADVVFAGDIVFNDVTPIMWAGPVSNWIAALERIGETGARKILGGHGPVAGPADLEELIGYWRTIDNEARALRSSGAAAADAARTIVFSEEYASAPWGSWGNRERTAVNVAMIYREIDKPGKALSPIERLGLLLGAADLAAELTPVG